MAFPEYILDQYRRISSFLFLMVGLLIFNAVFNLFYNWAGVSLIVRIYLFIISFLLVFNIASDDISAVKKEYVRNNPEHGRWMLFLEARVIPFLFIYLLTVIFTLIDYLSKPDWPLNPLLSLLNGRYSNQVIYCLILLFVLKIRHRPLVTIPLFFVVSSLYFLLDYNFYEIIPVGPGIAVYKLVKAALVSYFIFWEFNVFGKRIRYSLLASAGMSIAVFLLVAGSYFAGWMFAGRNSFVRIESVRVLARMGFSFTLDSLKTHCLEVNNPSVLKDYIMLSRYYFGDSRLTLEEWSQLLYRNSGNNLNRIAGWMIEEKQIPASGPLLDLLTRDSRTLENTDLVRLAAISIQNNVQAYVLLAEKAEEKEVLYYVLLLGETGSLRAVPFLAHNLFNRDWAIAQAAYDALVKITGVDPVREKNSELNDVSVFATFMELYSRNIYKYQ